MNENNKPADKLTRAHSRQGTPEKAGADRDSQNPAPRKTARWRIVIRWMIPLFLLLALAGGLIVGYVVVGKQSLSEVFEWKTWQHVIDLVFAP
ncbi:DNA-directed RNA polymerase subunit beta [Paenibacillus mangrovi]